MLHPLYSAGLLRTSDSRLAFSVQKSQHAPHSRLDDFLQQSVPIEAERDADQSSICLAIFQSIIVTL